MIEDNGNSKLRAVAWSELFPWLLIFRTFRLAISFRLLVAGAAAVLLMTLVWGGLGWLILPQPQAAIEASIVRPGLHWAESYRSCPWLLVTRAVPDQPALLAPEVSAVQMPTETAQATYLGALLRPWVELSRPLWGVFHPAE